MPSELPSHRNSVPPYTPRSNLTYYSPPTPFQPASSRFGIYHISEMTEGKKHLKPLAENDDGGNEEFFLKKIFDKGFFLQTQVHSIPLRE